MSKRDKLQGARCRLADFTAIRVLRSLILHAGEDGELAEMQLDDVRVYDLFLPDDPWVWRRREQSSLHQAMVDLAHVWCEEFLNRLEARIGKWNIHNLEDELVFTTCRTTLFYLTYIMMRRSRFSPEVWSGLCDRTLSVLSSHRDVYMDGGAPKDVHLFNQAIAYLVEERCRDAKAASRDAKASRLRAKYALPEGIEPLDDLWAEPGDD